MQLSISGQFFARWHQQELWAQPARLQESLMMLRFIPECQDNLRKLQLKCDGNYSCTLKSSEKYVQVLMGQQFPKLFIDDASEKALTSEVECVLLCLNLEETFWVILVLLESLSCQIRALLLK